MPKRRHTSGESNASSRSSLSPAPPAPEPVPTVNDDGEVVAAPPDAPPSNVQHFYQELKGAGNVQGYQQGKGYTMDDIQGILNELTKDDIQSTKGTPNPKQRTLRSRGKKKERNEGLRIDMQGRTTRGTYEQIAIQNNHNDNSHTLAQIHIQVNTKDPIQLRVAKWAMKRSLTERCIVKLLEAETTVKAVKRKRARESDESSQKEPRMSQ